jgi:hypothetical protein
MLIAYLLIVYYIVQQHSSAGALIKCQNIDNINIDIVIQFRIMCNREGFLRIFHLGIYRW